MFIISCDKQAEESNYTVNTQFPEEFIGFAADKKIYITSVGQSIDVDTFRLHLNALGVKDYVYDPLLNASDVEKGSIVFAVVGSSIKSLAEKGLTKESELSRALSFVGRFSCADFYLITLHTGGTLRRGATSDSLLKPLVSDCSLVLFKADGNSDLKISDWAREADIPYCQFEDNVTEMLKLLMGYRND